MGLYRIKRVFSYLLAQPQKLGAGLLLPVWSPSESLWTRIREPTPKREPLLIVPCPLKISEVSKPRLKAKASNSLQEESLN